MKLPPYITFEVDDNEYILKTAEPYHIMLVCYGKLMYEPDFVNLRLIAGYNIALTPCGCLPGNYYPLVSNLKEYCTEIADAMADFYLSAVIAKNPTKFDSFKL